MSPRARRRGSPGALHEAKEVEDEEDAQIKIMDGVPFIAEYIAAEKLPLRAEASPTSKVVGFLEKGEVVAVTQVHNGNEMRIHRLRWCDSSLTRVLLRPVSMRVRTANRLDTLWVRSLRAFHPTVARVLESDLKSFGLPREPWEAMKCAKAPARWPRQG